MRTWSQSASFFALLQKALDWDHCIELDGDLELTLRSQFDSGSHVYINHTEPAMLSCPNAFSAERAELLHWRGCFNGWRGATRGLNFGADDGPFNGWRGVTRAFDFRGNDLVGMIVVRQIYYEDGTLSKV